ncbi:hypothetical protein [Streptomyces microflavus]|uniref:hypothetical protein n=1 Tax=Streptomyces microflavus TaxID=1919 RepID=UPI002E327B5E|nr:hypothetical protein [Streptomyces microflavus]
MPVSSMRAWNPTDAKTGQLIPQWGAAEIATMTANEITAATNVGHFNNYILGSEPEGAQPAGQGAAQLSGEDLAAFGPGEIVAACRAGHLDDYLTGKTRRGDEGAGDGA